MSSQTLSVLRRLLRYLPRARLLSLGLQLPLSVLPGLLDLLSVSVVARLTGALSGAALQDHLPGVKVFGGSGPDQSVWLIGIFVLLAWSSSLTKLLLQYLQCNVCADIWRDLSDQAFRLVLRQPYEYHLGRRSSDVSAQILQNFQTLASQTISPALLIFSGLASTILLSIGVLVIGRWLAVFLIISLAVIYAIFTSFVTPRLRVASRQQLYYRSASTGVLNESMALVGDIQLAGAEDFFINQFKSIGIKAHSYDVGLRILPNLPRIVIEPMGITLIFVVGALPALMTKDPQEITSVLPFLATMAMAALKLTPPLQDLFRSILQLRGSLPNLETALDLLDLPDDRYSLGSPDAPSPAGVFPRHTIQMDQVSYRYPGHENWVLKNVSLNIPVGSRIAFIGTSGSGKTTAANVLLGLLQPKAGQVCLDGIPIEGLDLPAWQASCAHVPQAINLLNKSVQENVAFGMTFEQAEQCIDRVWDALEAAQLQDFVSDLPLGLHTIIGENGLRLSGGQRQRIALARAFFRQARFLVLDEATSALDNRTESEVIEALEVVGRRCTTVVIAHRLSTIKRCDRIYEFKEGVIVNSGTFDDLETTSGSFQELLRLENLQAH